ncbi:c-type cytochrome [bacterium]|nr:c-type cytochrome [bacterium]
MTSALWSYCLLAALAVTPVDGNRLAYLDGQDIYYPHTKFPKLITPQWVGEEGVEAVVIFAIDDMRDTAKYEAYLRPILQRLKAIDGRAPVSIMTCAVKPDDPQLQTWLQEGLSLEVHTFDHPCPLLQGGDFAKAKGTYDKCVDLMFSIPNNTPVAYRMPCCDSLNTVSPRFYKEIFNKTTSNGKFLQISSSVFQVYTADDPEIPRELLFDADGKERFRKYFPKGLKRGDQTHDRFVNYIENYPYPYVIGNQCWEFPCMTPSDWEANFLHQPNNPQTVEDMKAALDITVLKQGVLNLVFHPHGWIQAEQINELIDHAVAKHGKKVKFLTFKEAIERLNKNLLAGQPLRETWGVRFNPLIDVNHDGYLDVILTGARRYDSRQPVAKPIMRLWSPTAKTWDDKDFPITAVYYEKYGSLQARFGVLQANGHSSLLSYDWLSPYEEDQAGTPTYGFWQWVGQKWRHDNSLLTGLRAESGLSLPTDSHAYRLRDIDGDGVSEIVVGSEGELDADRAILNRGQHAVYQYSGTQGQWEKLPFHLPSHTIISPLQTLETPFDQDSGQRFVDIDEDGKLDIVYSSADRYGVWLFESMDKGWSIELLSGQRGDKPAEEELLPIVRADGTDNGFFVRDRALHWMNEDTADRPNLIVSWDFDKLLGDRMPSAKTPRAAIDSMRVAPGYTVELMAHEPEVMDPVAMQWGPDGKLWVVEMADYPNGLDGRGQPGGRVRFLEDTDSDGQYDKSTLFLDGVAFPSGVHPWKNGVLVSAAPDIFFAADTNGDGQADVREVLYTGFVEGNQQHRVNGFTWGLEGWLYVGNGDSGGTITSIKTGKTLEIRGRDLRIKPETGEMEAVNGQTQFGRACDDFGHWFGNNNSRPMWQYVLEDRYLSRNPHIAPPDSRRDVSNQPGPAPIYPASKTLTRFNDFDRANRFTSACSAMVFRDDFIVPGLSAQGLGLSDKRKSPVTGSGPQHLALNPQLSFVSEPVHNLVHREVLSFDGIRYSSQRLESERESEFLASTDNWFRPTQLKTGPDGSLWIADMYRLVIEHPQWIPQEWQERLNVREGDDKGRLWRVYPTGTKPRAVPRLGQLSLPELAKMLDSPNGWQRDMVQQLLVERRSQQAEIAAVIPVLAHLAESSSAPAVRAQALWTLQTLDALKAEHLMTALRDPHPLVRAAAIRLSEGLAKYNDALLRQIANLANDPHPGIQLQLAATLGELPGDMASDALATLASQTEDPDVRAMLLSSLTPYNLPAQVQALRKSPGLTTSGHPLLEPLLIYAVANNDSESLNEFAKLLLAGSPAEAKPWQWAAVETWLAAQKRSGKSWSGWLEVTQKVEPQLAEQWSAWLNQLPPMIEQPDLTPDQRANALKIYGQTSRNTTFNPDWLKPTQPLAIQLAAIELAGELGSSDVGKEIVMGWRNLSPALRSGVRQHLLGRPAIAQALVRQVELEELTPADIDPETTQFLLSHRDADVRKGAHDALAPVSDEARAQLIAEYLRSMPEQDDAAAGRELFAKRCAQCHKLGDLGHAVGPDLAALTDKSVTALVTAVLNPNKAVETKFLQFGVQTTSGQVHTGILQQETATSLTLLAAEAKSTTILRNDIEELYAINKSLMPEGLEKELTPPMLADLVAFIRGNVPLPSRKTFPGNQPQRVVADSEGVFTLTPATCEIYGPTIVLEEKYGNLGWWSSADDFVTWTIDVPESKTYRIEIIYACDSQAAGHSLLVSSRGAMVTQKIEATAGWDDYQTMECGKLELSAGVQTVTCKPARRPLPALMDLKLVRLIPEE